MARQRYCRRLARYRNTLRVSADPVAKPAADTRAEAGVLDLRKRMRARDGLSAGGRWIRTIGPCRERAGYIAEGEFAQGSTGGQKIWRGRRRKWPRQPPQLLGHRIRRPVGDRPAPSCG